MLLLNEARTPIVYSSFLYAPRAVHSKSPMRLLIDCQLCWRSIDAHRCPLLCWSLRLRRRCHWLVRRHAHTRPTCFCCRCWRRNAHLNLAYLAALSPCLRSLRTACHESRNSPHDLSSVSSTEVISSPLLVAPYSGHPFHSLFPFSDTLFSLPRRLASAPLHFSFPFFFMLAGDSKELKCKVQLLT